VDAGDGSEESYYDEEVDEGGDDAEQERGE